MSIEQEIVEKGLTAPRVTPADIETAISGEYYFTAYEGVLGAHHSGTVAEVPDEDHGGPLLLLTICVLVLRNGFTVTGESACASPENFNAEIGRKIAREHAKQKIWALEGYALRNRLTSSSSSQ